MKSLIKIWKNRKQIAEGIKNNIFKQEHIEALAAQRLKICKECSFFDTIGTNCEVPGTQPCCSICGCSMAFKSRSLSSACPHNKPKWLAVTTQDEEDEINYQINNTDQNGD